MIDTQKEIELSCSPVKRGRREAIEQNYESHNSSMAETRQRQIEEKGSRSPDKKRRRGKKPSFSDESGQGLNQYKMNLGQKFEMDSFENFN